MSGETRKPGGDGAFFARWSERKRRGVPPVEDAAPAELAPDLPEKTDEEVLEELGLPAPETLQPGDDFSGFMAKAVPERLRNRALRKLWLTDPVLANLDELVDYGEDFTDAATVVENLQTVYRVGKGMLPDPEPDAPESVEVAEADVALVAEEAEDEAPVEEDPQASTDPVEEADSQDSPADLSSDAAMDFGEAPRPRRMRFHFET